MAGRVPQHNGGASRQAQGQQFSQQQMQQRGAPVQQRIYQQYATFAPQFAGWVLQKAPAESLPPGVRRSWQYSIKNPMNVSTDELVRIVKKLRAKNDRNNITVQDIYDRLKSEHIRLQIDNLIIKQDLEEGNPDVEWKMAALDVEYREISRWPTAVKDIKLIRVILKSQLKPNAILSPFPKSPRSSGVIVDSQEPVPARNPRTGQGPLPNQPPMQPGPGQPMVQQPHQQQQNQGKREKHPQSGPPPPPPPPPINTNIVPGPPPPPPPPPQTPPNAAPFVQQVPQLVPPPPPFPPVAGPAPARQPSMRHAPPKFANGIPAPYQKQKVQPQPVVQVMSGSDSSDWSSDSSSDGDEFIEIIDERAKKKEKKTKKGKPVKQLPPPPIGANASKSKGQKGPKSSAEKLQRQPSLQIINNISSPTDPKKDVHTKVKNWKLNTPDPSSDEDSYPDAGASVFSRAGESHFSSPPSSPQSASSIPVRGRGSIHKPKGDDRYGRATSPGPVHPEYDPPGYNIPFRPRERSLERSRYGRNDPHNPYYHERGRLPDNISYRHHLPIMERGNSDRGLSQERVRPYAPRSSTYDSDYPPDWPPSRGRPQYAPPLKPLPPPAPQIPYPEEYPLERLRREEALEHMRRNQEYGRRESAPIGREVARPEYDPWASGYRRRDLEKERRRQNWDVYDGFRNVPPRPLSRGGMREDRRHW